MKREKTVILFLLVCLTWGTTWLAMRIAVETIPPVFATGMRFVFAAPFLILLAAFTRTPLLFPPGQREFQLVISVFYFAIPFTLMIYGEQYVSSAMAAIVFATMPVAVLVASIFMLQEKTNFPQLIGLFFALGALVGIVLNESSAEIDSRWRGVVALIVAVAIHAVIYAQCKKRGTGVSVLTFNALPCLLAGISLIVAGYFFEQPQVMRFSLNSIAATLYLGAFAGVCGILSYFSLQKNAGPFKASLVFLVFPLVAILLENAIYDNSLASGSVALFFPLALGVFLTLINNTEQ